MYSVLSVCVFILLVLLYVQLHPVFGKNSTKEQRDTYNKLPYYINGRFQNQISTVMHMGAKEFYRMTQESLFSKKEKKPKQPVPFIPLDVEAIENHEATVTWFGHSAYLIGIEGKKLFVDPMLGYSPSPIPFVGSKRFNKRLPIEIENLPFIDAVFITHDHYDHLDYSSIQQLKDKVGRFFVPLGVANHLERWGVEKEKISEHAWWDEFQWNELTIASTPARHFSGRGLFNRDSTLWTSWVLISNNNTKIFIGGDSGYGPHFKEVGEKYGPFDLTMMECGQYDEKWPLIHMMPEETVQAHLDVKGRLLFPVHWGAFTLSFHDWKEPIERALNEAQKKEVDVVTAMIGEVVPIHRKNVPNHRWWEKLKKEERGIHSLEREKHGRQ